MQKQKTVAALLVLILAGVVVLQQIRSSRRTITAGLSDVALKGQQVFEQKRCYRCHSLGDPQRKLEMEAPDLTNPFLANDSLFVRAHLTFLEESRMPEIELNSDEIRWVSVYVAELHRAKHSALAPETEDTAGPVCNAPISKEKAMQEGLWFRYLEDTFYFECEECKAVFVQAPEAYRQIMFASKEEKSP